MVSVLPSDVKLVLFIFTGDLVALHVNSFEMVLFNGTMDDAEYSDVISGEGSWWLQISKIEAAVADGDGFASIHVEATNFGFSS